MTPTGRILLKPNVVLAHQEIFPNAFTRAEFLDGVLSAVKSRAEAVKEIAVGERSGITIPTRFNFQNAGYPEIISKHGSKAYYFDESKHVPVQLKNRQALRDTLYIPKPITRCDSLINLPKFKAHPWSRLTLSLKNFIGLQDDRHRLVDHNQFLEHKIADLQEVIQPKFIAIDGIAAGQKMMLTPTPFMLGAIIMGTNSCAVDTVGCHMVSVNPQDVIHLQYASQRGFGPMDLDQIEVGGDYPLAEVQQHTQNFKFCVERIDDYLGHPKYDPHGDPIPAADGTVAPRKTRPLGDCAAGTRFRLAQVTDQSPEFLREMSETGIAIGVAGLVAEAHADGGQTLNLGGTAVHIDARGAESLSVDTSAVWNR